MDQSLTGILLIVVIATGGFFFLRKLYLWYRRMDVLIKRHEPQNQDLEAQQTLLQKELDAIEE